MFLLAEGQQPLHLLLSSSNPKGLEHAKLLAENLLDTICSECGASRLYFCYTTSHILYLVKSEFLGVNYWIGVAAYK